MELNEIISNTNDAGRLFCTMWLKGYEILGTEDLNESGWFYVIYCGERDVRVASMPRKDTDCNACFFGDLKYFAMIAAYDKLRLPIKWRFDNSPAHPIWWTSDKELIERFDKQMYAIIRKYEQSR